MQVGPDGKIVAAGAVAGGAAVIMAPVKKNILLKLSK